MVMNKVHIQRIDYKVSLAYTYLTSDLKALSGVYVFGEDGLIEKYSNTKSHRMAIKEYGVSNCYDWYFFNETEFQGFLSSCIAKNICDGRYKRIDDLNSYMVSVLSYERYGDLNGADLAEGYLYLGRDMKLYYYLGTDDSSNETLFVLGEDIAGKADGLYSLQKNVEVIVVHTGYTKAYGISSLMYEIKNQNEVFLQF